MRSPSPTTRTRWPTGSWKRDATLVTGGTDNQYLVLLDVTSFGLTGSQGGVGVAGRGRRDQQQQPVPADPNGAWYTSGVRLAPRR